MTTAQRLPFLLSLLGLAAACGENPVREDSSGDFTGTWILTSTILPKSPCGGVDPQDTRIEEVTITQSGSNARLQFVEYSAVGTVASRTLIANGTLPGGESIHFEFIKVGEALEGTVRISGEGCEEERDAVVRRRAADRNFAGHWGFRLTVEGEAGCAHIQDYDDCFRIFQTGTDLLVVDEEAGNLFGTVIGSVAEIVRDTEAETTSLIFFMNEAGDELTGTAIRVFHEQSCRTDLSFLGTLRDEPCANQKH